MYICILLLSLYKCMFSSYILYLSLFLLNCEPKHSVLGLMSGLQLCSTRSESSPDARGSAQRSDSLCAHHTGANKDHFGTHSPPYRKIMINQTAMSHHMSSININPFSNDSQHEQDHLNLTSHVSPHDL